MSEVATTGSFTGADVDGLDHLAQEFNGAAEIVDMVKMACEVIVAAASIFGPFGAAFVAYLKGTVIPWLTKVSAALKAMSKVLSFHSSAQKDASSSTTSLPSYTGTANLPTTSTLDAPTLPAATSTAVTPASPTTPTGTTVAAPPTIGGTTPATPAAGTAATTTGAGVTPFVSAVTALTGLVTAVDHLIHPGSGTTATTPTDPATTPTDPGTTPATPVTPTDPGTTPTTPVTPTDPGATPTTPVTPTDPGATPTTPTTTVPGTAPVLGSTGGIDLSTLQPLHPGDSVGVLSIPVDIAPDGTVTPLIHTPLDPAPTTPPATPIGDAAAPAVIAPATHHAEVPSTSSGGSSGGSGAGSGGGYSGGSGGGGDTGAPVITSAPPTDALTTAATAPTAPPVPAAATAAHAEPGLRTETIGSHDGLFTGMGQATGIGAGAAALARAVLSEARQHGNGSVLGAVPLPFDADADGAAQTEIYQGSIG